MSIRIMDRAEIDHIAWDKCVSGSTNGMVYSKTSFLDLMTDQWFGLVIDEYRAVMAIPFRSKWGITYVYQPAFVQQLGMIGNFSEAELEESLGLIRDRIKYGHLPLNFANETSGAKTSANYVLSLEKPYAEIARGFTYYLRKTTREDKTRDLLYKPSASFESAIHMYRDRYGQRFPHVHEQSYQGLVRFSTQYPDQVLLREAWRRDELLSSIMLLKDSRRLYLVISVNTAEGKKAEANRFLIDQLIREFAGSALLLDFEGSDIPGVAAYYEGYGAWLQPYYTISWNQLPFPLRLFKK